MSRFKGHGWIISTRKPMAVPPIVVRNIKFGRPVDYIPGIPCAGEATVQFDTSEEDLFDPLPLSTRVALLELDEAAPDIAGPLLERALWAADQATRARRRYRSTRLAVQSHLRAAADVLRRLSHPFSTDLS